MTGQASSGFLLTSAGGMLHLDTETRALRHATCSPGRRNLVLHLAGPSAWLIVVDPLTGVAQRCVVPAAQGGLSLAAMDAPSPWRLRAAGPWVEVVCDAGGLRATGDGGLDLAAESEASRFCVVGLASMRCLDTLLGHQWLRQGGPPRAVQASLRFADRPVLLLDGQEIDPSGLPGPFVTGEGTPRQMSVIAPGGRVMRLVLYNPVICLAVFGPDAFYGVLGVALDALDRFGGYDGALCIAADRPAEAMACVVPNAFAGRWRHVPMTGEDGLFARYTLPDWGLEAYQPVLYMDADVVANARLRPMLARLAGSRRVHMATEDRLFAHVAGRGADRVEEATEGWFGAWLFRGDPRLADTGFALGSSGIIAADHAGRLQPLCALVQALRQAVDPELVRRYTDQALANYALHALGEGDFKTLDRFVDFARAAETAPPTRRGLMHFHSGVGQGAAKLAAMRRYVATLADAAPVAAQPAIELAAPVRTGRNRRAENQV